MRTDAEITEEIQRLRTGKTLVPRTGVLGDNHQAIDIQIEVLEKRLCEEDIFTRWGLDDHHRNNAMDAYLWLTREMDETPSAGWAPWLT